MEIEKLYPKYSEAYYNRGDSFFYKEDYDKALIDYTNAINLNPEHASAYNSRGVTYYRKGNYDQAIKDCEEAARLDPKNELYKRNLNYLQNRSR